MDENNNVGAGTAFGVAPSGPSPDGGTWIGVARQGTGFVETFGQTIADFVIGETYDLSWSAGNFGALTGPNYIASNAFEVLLSGGVIGNGGVIGLGSDWVSQGLQFTATSTSHEIAFRLMLEPASYLSIDGIRLAPATVPLPGALLLLGGGLVGLGALRRKA